MFFFERKNIFDRFFVLKKYFSKMLQIHHQKQRALVGILVKIPKSISIISKYLKYPMLRLNQGFWVEI